MPIMYDFISGLKIFLGNVSLTRQVLMTYGSKPYLRQLKLRERQSILSDERITQLVKEIYKS